MRDLPLGGRKFLRRIQSELVAQDSRNRVGVRIVRHLRLPVPGYGPAVQFGRADLTVYVGRDLPVMIRAERPRQFDLHGLSRRQGVIQACTLARQRFIPLIGLVRQENGLWLAVRSEGDRLSRGTLSAEARQDPGEPAA